MPIGPLRVAAFCAYLASWLVLLIGSIVNSIPRGQHPPLPKITLSGSLGTLLQAAALFLTVRSVPAGSLRPHAIELLAVLVLAPLSAALFIWAIGSAPAHPSRQTLITNGAYALVRHPIYLAFLAILLATGCLLSAGVNLLFPTALYIAGTEFRIAAEELELSARFPTEHAAYRQRTRFRYLPGIR